MDQVESTFYWWFLFELNQWFEKSWTEDNCLRLLRLFTFILRQRGMEDKWIIWQKLIVVTYYVYLISSTISSIMVETRMEEYVQEVWDTFGENIKWGAATPTKKDLFEVVDAKSKILSKLNKSRILDSRSGQT